MFGEISLIRKRECRAKLEWMDKAETEMFQYCATDEELTEVLQTMLKKGPAIQTTLFFLWTSLRSHELLNRQTVHPVNSSRHLQIPGQAWIVFPIISQLSALPTVC